MRQLIPVQCTQEYKTKMFCNKISLYKINKVWYGLNWPENYSSLFLSGLWSLPTEEHATMSTVWVEHTFTPLPMSWFHLKETLYFRQHFIVCCSSNIKECPKTDCLKTKNVQKQRLSENTVQKQRLSENIRVIVFPLIAFKCTYFDSRQ